MFLLQPEQCLSRGSTIAFNALNRYLFYRFKVLTFQIPFQIAILPNNDDYWHDIYTYFNKKTTVSPSLKTAGKRSYLTEGHI